MPCIDDWLSDPLSIVQAVFGESADTCPQKIKEYFTKRLESEDAIARVPSLNDIPLHCLKPDSLVRYRCMIQDMFNPEYFAGVYQVTDKCTGKKTPKSALFSDVAHCPPNHELSFESHDVILSRNVLYCVPIPGETTWAKKAYSRTDNQLRVVPGPSHSQSNKRSLDEDDDTMLTNETSAQNSGEPADSASKRVRQSENTPAGATEKARTPELNFPLPEEKGPACIVKVYESDDHYKVNDMVEFIGVLSIDPALAIFQSSSDDYDILQADQMELDEAAAHSPPPSLVPRLHCILSKTLPHSNPLLPVCLTDEEKGSKLQDLCDVRQEIVTLFSQLLGGDALAAEYLLLHLISTVYSRVDIMAIGKFSLNLQFPSNSSEGLSQKVYELLQNLVSKAHLLSISIANMNSVNLVPKKDCSADRVVSGILQLSDGTHLILDETALQAGKLEEKGVRNVQALTDLILWQKVQYDFTYHRTDFLTNVVVLILSEGKSLLQPDCQVPVYVQHAPCVADSLPEELLTKMRMYLGLARISPYTLSADMQKVLEDDFVRSRQEDKKTMNADLFHSLLVIARLLSLSLGQTSLTPKVWSKARELEQARTRRLGIV